jgi:hypothetical protein
MQKMQTFAVVAVAASFFFAAGPVSHAQIIGHVDADIHHSFMIGNATLPPGHYVFRMESNDLGEMDVMRADGEAGAQFLVRQSIDSKTPQHTQLVFLRYGHKEFLEHVYDRDDKMGVTVLEPSRVQALLQKQGDKPIEHTEDQN